MESRTRKSRTPAGATGNTVAVSKMDIDWLYKFAGDWTIGTHTLHLIIEPSAARQLT
jgi:hypothetical protein